MNTTIAKIISFVIHPIYFPLLGMIAGVEMAQQASFVYFKNDLTPFYILIGVNTIVIPSLTLVVFKRLGMISNFNIDKANERIIPFVITITYLVVTYFLLREKFYVPILLSLFLGVVISLILVTLITLRFKISVHMVGVAGFFGGILALSQLFHINTNYYLMLISLAMGVVAAARLILKAHTPWQVITGTLLGFFVVYFVTRYGVIV